MLFFSFNYFFFLFIVFVVYYFINRKYQYHVLLLGSILFISIISIEVALFAIFFTAINYTLGLLLARYETRPILKNKLFWISILVDVSFLVFFKYINFLFENINWFDSLFHIKPKLPYLKLVIPAGISYYTFQAIGYLIRINRGSEKPERNFVKFALFLLFFPKFLSGPIERSNHFILQIEKSRRFNPGIISQGLRLFLWGLFKKIVIANNLYTPVSHVYNDLHSHTGFALITVLFIQTIYIYTDFSGYTDMALGSAKIFGIDLVDNFRRPFLAKNITEFWKRWHISLSSWCNDFIYKPFIIKFRQLGALASVFGIFISFFIIGIWHGANWTFVLLGLLQGIAIVSEFYSKRIRFILSGKFHKMVVNTFSRLFVFFFFSFSLIFFFSNSLNDSWYYISHLFADIKINFDGVGLNTDKPRFLLACMCFLVIFIFEIYNENGQNTLSVFLNKPRWVRWIGYYLCIFLIYFSNSRTETFVYMKF
jgi:alginate O-acetyltransferase complex protein AlgI